MLCLCSQYVPCFVVGFLHRTVQQGDKHVVFDFTSKVVDFLTIGGNPDGKLLFPWTQGGGGGGGGGK